MLVNSREYNINNILIACYDLLEDELVELSDKEISILSAVDTNWCETDSDVNSAFYAMYEELKGLI